MELHKQPYYKNPYVWDFPINGEYPTEPYDELGVTGGVVTTTLLLCISYCTTGVLKPYKKMLYMCAITDFTFWLVDTFTEVKGKQYENIILAKMEGPVKYFSRWVHVTGVAAYVTTACLSMTVLPAQAFFRYYYMTRSRPLSTAKTVALFILALICALMPGSASWFSYDRSPEVNPGFNYGKLWYREVPLPILMIGDTNSFYQKVYFGSTAVLFTIAYFLLIMFSYYTSESMKVQHHTYTAKTKRVQKQMNAFLLCQMKINGAILRVGQVWMCLVPVHSALRIPQGAWVRRCAGSNQGPSE
ncbi:unnamed protein product [Bursaphelenchus okinawaensis]|uniref:G-protein coupled receptors family 1 profile domain-containing protein n=1 Tax=Bursaphelenchus okinawaensis TaxID=465554 RepID=A0A811LRW5_9BILA|nr:unnamed protein product [Bursaphelenchus okinawaensis]CAG9128500.1 unnamed protein product [Bursaphelenchus okinawaensis]